MSFGNDNAWKLELDAARPLVEKAIDLGINFFDTANVYSLGRSEEITGECLKGYRDDVIIATKVHGPMGKGPNDSGLSRIHVMQQVSASLKRLQTDHVDLYQTHRWDYETPIEETLTTFNDIVRQGRARYIGASSMFAWQFLSALHTSERLGLEKFVSMQNHYNLLYREEEREMIPLCKQTGIAVIPWSPLARGFLTGKYKRGETPKTVRYENERMSNGHNPLAERYFKPEDFDVVETVTQVARENDVSPSQIGLAWLFHRGVTAPIIGVTKTQHVEEAVEALEIKLDSDDMKRLEDAYKPHPVIGHE
jgi:aryl-alcohol dehydrogenase-like predicted oxidoreductase